MQPSHSPVGYVGEWHTHPGPVGPSGIDMSTITATALEATDAIALVVVARYDEEWRSTTSVVQPPSKRSDSMITKSRPSRRRSDKRNGSADAVAG